MCCCLLKYRSVATVHCGAPVTLAFLGVEGGVGGTLDTSNHSPVVALVEAAAVGGVGHVTVTGSLTRLVDDGAGRGDDYVTGDISAGTFLCHQEAEFTRVVSRAEESVLRAVHGGHHCLVVAG